MSRLGGQFHKRGITPGNDANLESGQMLQHPTIAQVLVSLRAGLLGEAEADLDAILAQRPADPQALHLLGLVRYQQGRHSEAADLIRQAIGLAPGNPNPINDLATVLEASGKPDEALSVLHQALRLRPDYPLTHNNIGVSLEAKGQVAGATAAYQQAVRLKADYVDAWVNLGNVLQQLGRFQSAVEAYGQAIRYPAGQIPAAYGGLAQTLGEQGKAEAAIANLREGLRVRPDPALHSALLYVLHYVEEDPSILHQEHLAWAQQHAEPLKHNVLPFANDRSPNRRLRIGYVSPDFRDHAIARFVEPILACHDHQQFEVFCYSDTRLTDQVTQRLRESADQWHEIRNLSHADLASLIRRHRVDILIDLRGHGASNRMLTFAQRPAPVQISMIGYFDTTGLASIDYQISDQAQDPAGLTEMYHTEQLARLDSGGWCYWPQQAAPNVSPPPALKHGAVTFGCLNKMVKVSPACAALWAQIIRSVPRSKLLVSAAGDSVQSVRSLLEAAAILPDQLVVLEKARSQREYLQRFGEIDIALDTFPFAGITTTCDGLWMGVPLITLCGSTSVSRIGTSLLAAAGLPDLIATTPRNYVQAAVSLACDSDRLVSLRRSMRERLTGSMLFNGPIHTQSLEAAYRSAWSNWCAPPK